MIPAFDPKTGYLPAGEHEASWDEITARFGWNSTRRRLLGGLQEMARSLHTAGCDFFLLDGSFVTSKEYPDDFDACCDFSKINIRKTDLRLFGTRNEMKADFLGELFPEHYAADGRFTFREFFQTDRDGTAKGVVRLLLDTVP